MKKKRVYALYQILGRPHGADLGMTQRKKTRERHFPLQLQTLLQPLIYSDREFHCL